MHSYALLQKIGGNWREKKTLPTGLADQIQGHPDGHQMSHQISSPSTKALSCHHPRTDSRHRNKIEIVSDEGCHRFAQTAGEGSEKPQSQTSGPFERYLQLRDEPQALKPYRTSATSSHLNVDFGREALLHGCTAPLSSILCFELWSPAENRRNE